MCNGVWIVEQWPVFCNLQPPWEIPIYSGKWNENVTPSTAIWIKEKIFSSCPQLSSPWKSFIMHQYAITVLVLRGWEIFFLHEVILFENVTVFNQRRHAWLQYSMAYGAWYREGISLTWLSHVTHKGHLTLTWLSHVTQEGHLTLTWLSHMTQEGHLTLTWLSHVTQEGHLTLTWLSLVTQEGHLTLTWLSHVTQEGHLTLTWLSLVTQEGHLTHMTVSCDTRGTSYTWLCHWPRSNNPGPRILGGALLITIFCLSFF